MPDRELIKILYVEDEPDIAQVAKLALETVGGFTIEICENGQIALDKGPAFQPDLVLMDVMMPEMDGPTALQEMQKMPEFKDVPVIFMTAKVQPVEIAEYKALGAVDVIPKPFDPMTLAEQVRQVWKGC
ncbi:MAG: response regulator [Gammaproteobacteria bacterium]|nr:response regulator [Gammaproteobacteria bacterium]